MHSFTAGSSDNSRINSGGNGIAMQMHHWQMARFDRCILISFWQKGLHSLMGNAAPYQKDVGDRPT